MQCLNLAGSWALTMRNKAAIPGELPGCNYLDLMKNGTDDPFFGMNENTAKEIAHEDCTYERCFSVDSKLLDLEHVELVASGLDTLCEITINNKIVGKTDNINRTWRFDVKPLLKIGENSIRIHITNPFDYIAKKQAVEEIKGTSFGTKGIMHLRKTPCHFGWDWGPSLPPAGLIGSIELQAYDVRLEDLQIRQIHKDGKVTLDINALVSPGASVALTLTSPEGDVLPSLEISEPKLWWCNGLGEQPLYTLDVAVLYNGETVETASRKIGLRTIELDTEPDEWGNQFRFKINGAPIFAKGANWIPADSFITRVTKKDIDFYVKAAKTANMNMLRVWGGGHYESDAFYDACDRMGILVWQDFIFACSAYPLNDEAFLKNVRQEVIDNVRRLRHHASLAVWSGNNENEFFRMMWKKGSHLDIANMGFYHYTLRGWVNELDGQTAYWPGSPSSGDLKYKVHNLKKGEIRGDTHLWQIWHGMLPIEAFRKFPTRFCSEYGMESMPSMHTISTFTDEKTAQLFDPVMQLHQKSGGGNEKMLFYLLAKYRNPASFEDFVYLSQIVQANTVRFATDCWRRNLKKQNGALFWQFNDCWPVASWAGIDYEKQLKAVTYQARHFNKMLCLSNDYFDNRAEVYVVNEYPIAFKGEMQWELKNFNGERINSGNVPVSIGSHEAIRISVLKFDDILKGRKKEDAVLLVRLVCANDVLDEKSWLLVPDKNANLPKAEVKAECSAKDGVATVKLSSAVYARYVYLEAKDVLAPWSDNFFDIPAGESVVVTVPLPEGMDAKHLEAALKIKTLTDVKPKNGLLMDKWLRFSMIFKKKNFLTWIIFKFI